MSYQEKYLKYKNKYLDLKSKYNYKNLVQLNETEDSLINLNPNIINLNKNYKKDNTPTDTMDNLTISESTSSIFKQAGGNKKNTKKINKQFFNDDSDLSSSSTLSEVNSDSEFSSSETDW